MIELDCITSVTLPNQNAFDVLNIRNFSKQWASRDLICEFAARLCYNSQSKIGNTNDFIADRIAQGHLDVLEHGWLSANFCFESADNPYQFVYYLNSINRYFDYDLAADGRTMRIGGNLRTWQNMLPTLEDYFPKTTVARIANVAPQVFGIEVDGETVSKYGVFGDCKYENLLTSHGHLICVLGFANNEFDWRDRAATVYIQRLSRSCATQLVRHRTMSFSQMSQRYVDAGNFGYMLPLGLKNNSAAEKAIEQSFDAYHTLRDGGAKKEDARCVLPEATTTSIVVSGHSTSWRHFFDLRCDKAAQDEIRVIATTIRDLIGNDLFN